MSRINNEFRLSGRMGGTLEKSFNPNNGNPIGRVSLAVDNSYTDRESGEIVERTTWLDLTFYNAKQIERLEKVFGMIDLPPRGKKCEAIDGIRDLRGTAFMAPRGWLPADDWAGIDSTDVDAPGPLIRHPDPYGEDAGQGQQKSDHHTHRSGPRRWVNRG